VSRELCRVHKKGQLIIDRLSSLFIPYHLSTDPLAGRRVYFQPYSAAAGLLLEWDARTNGTICQKYYDRYKFTENLGAKQILILIFVIDEILEIYKNIGNL
jgi:hypothetical protein